MIKTINAIVDGINLNASHYVPLGKEEAVKRMEADGILKEHGKDSKWANGAFDSMKSEYDKLSVDLKTQDIKERSDLHSEMTGAIEAERKALNPDFNTKAAPAANTSLTPDSTTK